jgi:hypothetical protein
VLYERELKEGDPLRVTSQLIDADAKRLHSLQLPIYILPFLLRPLFRRVTGAARPR